MHLSPRLLTLLLLMAMPMLWLPQGMAGHPTSLLGDERPCRTCTSLEDMMKWSKKMLGLKKQGEGEAKVAVTIEQRTDCPLDKDELGRSTWKLLHTMSVTYPEKPNDEQKRDMSDFLATLSKHYPCDYCAKDFQQDLRTNPPRLESRKELAAYMCELHNRVNEKLGKERFDCNKTFERWKDGWADGSCDF